MVVASIWIFSYLLGSIPCGVLLARTRNINIREHGSGNIGATNVARTLGKTLGLLTLLGDLLKGLGAVALASALLPQVWEVSVAGLAVYLGHLFSIFLKFKGGKGVATGLGVLIYLMPLPTLCAAGIFALTLQISKYVSMGSMLAALTVPLLGIIFKSPIPHIYMACIIAILTLYKHSENIKRIISGTEARFIKK